MAVTKAGGPNVLCWTKNEMRYTFMLSAVTPGWKLHIQLLRIGWTEPFAEVMYTMAEPVGFISFMHVQEIIDSLVSYALPINLTPVNSDSIFEAVSNIDKYRMRYRVITPSATLPWTDDPTIITFAKGGVGNMVTTDEYLANHTNPFDKDVHFPGGSRFLTWVPSGRTMRYNEWGWLLYQTELSVQQYMRYQVSLADGTSYQANRGLPSSGNPDYFGRNWFIPTGVEQAKIDPDNKGVISYTIDVLESATNIIRASHKIVVDNRPYYDTLTIYYRNSMGGLDNICLRGIVQVNGGDIEKQEYRQSRSTHTNKEGETPYFKSEIRLKYKGSTGYISRKHKMALAELFNTTFCAFLHNEKWVPLRVPPQKLEPVSSKDELHEYTIEFETASTFEVMPQQFMNLL